jgi:predicted metal-dependent hydrolase
VIVLQSHREPASLFSPEVEVRRSTRRRRTVSAYREGDRVVVLVPSRLSRAEEAEWVTTMVARIEKAERRRRPTDDVLHRRATELSDRYLGGRAVAASVRWVDNQQARWGSCTPSDKTIRLTNRLQGLPQYVVDYVLIHELAHLLVSDHSADFWALVERYPMTERARGFLEGMDAAGARTLA